LDLRSASASVSVDNTTNLTSPSGHCIDCTSDQDPAGSVPFQRIKIRCGDNVGTEAGYELIAFYLTRNLNRWNSLG